MASVLYPVHPARRGDAWTGAKKVLLRPEAYVAMWRLAAHGFYPSGFRCFWVAVWTSKTVTHYIIGRSLISRSCAASLYTTKDTLNKKSIASPHIQSDFPALRLRFYSTSLINPLIIK